MKCQFCDKPATVHLTDLVEGEKTEAHLCAGCAEARGVLKPNKELNLPVIVQSLIGQHLGPESDELSRLSCPVCGIGYMEFRAAGRLGCPNDYDVFRGGLDPLLQRIHRASRHAGKTPRRPADAASVAEAASLRQRLSEAVTAERYEEAARIRDLLRQKEGSRG